MLANAATGGTLKLIVPTNMSFASERHHKSPEFWSLVIWGSGLLHAPQDDKIFN